MVNVPFTTFPLFLNLHSGGWSPNWVHSARRPLTGLLYLPWVIVRMENLVEWITGETEVLGENLPWCHFVHHKSHWPDPGLNPGGGKPATNRFSYGAATFPLSCHKEFLSVCAHRDRSVGIATGYGLDDQGGGSSSPGRVKNFHFSISSRLALGSTQPPIKWVLGALSWG
jgi:hypothetical protein